MWNVQGTKAPGSLKILSNVLKNYKVDVAALQETKQKGNEVMEVEDYVFFNSGSETQYFGTGFMVHKKVSTTIIEFKPISERICRLRLKGKYRKISIINVHAPTNEKKDEIKDQFYEEIGKVVNALPRYDVKIVLGDFNAKIGREEVYKSITGGYSLHGKTNENGEKLIQYATESRMKIMSTSFERKSIYKGTWMSPDGKTCNQIDHVLIEAKHKETIKNVKSRRGAMADSDHFMVQIKVKFEVPKPKKWKGNTIKRYDIKILEDENKMYDFQEKIAAKLVKPKGESVNTCFSKLEEALGGVATQILKKENNKTDNWYDEDCKRVTEKKSKARIIYLQNRNEENKRKYDEERRNAKKICRKKKRAMLEQKIEKIEEDYKAKSIRNFYRETKKQKTGYQPKLIYIKTKEGKLVTGTEKLNRWAEYFDSILNEDDQDRLPLQKHPMEEVVSNEKYTTPPALEEVITVLKEMKNYKSPGENGLVAELYKLGGETLQEQLHFIIKEVWNTETMPKRWSEALLCPIYKKGDRTECKNYRGIALLDVAYKIFAICVRDRLKKEVEKLIGEYQAGFKTNRSTSDQIFTLKLIIANSIENNIPLHLLFIDFKQAYDSINKLMLGNILSYFKIPTKLKKLINMTLENTKCKVLIDGQVSQSFEVKKGLRQGDPLSPILFNLILEWAIRESKLYTNGTIYHHSHQLLAYADDIAILTRSKDEMDKTFARLVEKAREAGLAINKEKTKYMLVGGQKNETGNTMTCRTTFGECNFEVVQSFNYLGVNISKDGGESEEIKARLIKGSKSAGALGNVLKNKNISRAAKKRIYKTIIRPVVLYGSENWVLTKKDLYKLEVWERRILRKIYGGKEIGGIWVPRTNRELYELYGESSITGVLKSYRLRWLGHLTRLTGDRVVKSVLNRGAVTKRRRGRPKEKWLNSVVKDLFQLGIKDWQEKAVDRKQWRTIVYEAMGLLGPEC